jgi:hypothetical protein
MSGQKFDDGKTPIYSGFLQYFPRAIQAVADISHYGFKKYGSWGGWRNVPDGLLRYTNAKARHSLAQDIEGPIDAESGKRHAAMEAWNAFARLELLLIEEEKNG